MAGDFRIADHKLLFAFLVVSIGLAAVLLNKINNYAKYEVSNISDYVNVVHAQAVATLALSPNSTTVGANQNFTVNINLNTSGNPIDGVDIYMLRFNPAILQVVDSNTGTAGVQIAPGSILPNTAINTVDNSTGTIQFSQSTSGGTNFTGSGTIATITFRGTASGTSSVNFDFTPGSTSDTNVAYQGVDQLSSVTNGSFTVDASGPTVSITAPTNGSTVTGTANVSASASDNIGVAGVQFRLDGANLGAEDTSSPFSISWNSATASNGSHSLTAVARDSAGNTTTSSAISVNVNNVPFDFSLTNGGSRSVTQGSSVTNTITASVSAGTPASVSFSASGLPSGVSASFSPTSCTPTCSSTLTLTATGAASVGTATITVTGTSSVTRTTTFSLTVNSSTFQRTLNISSLEGRSTRVISGTLNAVNNSTRSLIKGFPFTTDSSGNATITFDIPIQTVGLQLRATPFLARASSNVDLGSNITYSFPQLLIGDINQDNIINSVDYSVLNTNWFTSNSGSDLNQDGLVNSIDYSYMNKHWLISGEQ